MSQCREAHIRDRNVGQPQNVGKRGAILNQSCDALVRDRTVGHQDAGQRVHILNQDRDALIVPAMLVNQTLDRE